jgi:pimeloyl-ACP methyl ester carboxylesterase
MTGTTRTDLILLHGALGDATQLAPLADRLGRDRRTIVVELEGHGATPSPNRPLRIESFAASVLETMDDANISQADVFGYSMGGYVALYLAATWPDRVRRIATLATKLAWTPEIAARECALLDAATIRAKVPKFAAALEAKHTATGWEPLLTDTADLLRELGSRPRITDELLASIGQPVRISVGDRDATVTLDECVSAVRQLRNGELEVLPQTPHPFEKAPIERVAYSLSEFFGA